MFLKRSQTWKPSAMAATIVVALTAAVLAACAGGSASSAPTMPNVNGALQPYLEARNTALEYVLAGKTQLHGQDLTKMWTDYIKTESKANAWINTIAFDIQTNTPIDDASQIAFKQSAVDVTNSLTVLASDLEGKVNVAVVRPTPSPGSKVGLIPPIIDIKTVVELFRSTADWSVQHQMDLVKLRQQQQVERDALASRLVKCYGWPLWEALTATYKDPCAATTAGTQ